MPIAPWFIWLSLTSSLPFSGSYQCSNVRLTLQRKMDYVYGSFRLEKGEWMPLRGSITNDVLQAAVYTPAGDQMQLSASLKNNGLFLQFENGASYSCQHTSKKQSNELTAEKLKRQFLPPVEVKTTPSKPSSISEKKSPVSSLQATNGTEITGIWSFTLPEDTQSNIMIFCPDGTYQKRSTPLHDLYGSATPDSVLAASLDEEGYWRREGNERGGTLILRNDQAQIQTFLYRIRQESPVQLWLGNDIYLRLLPPERVCQKMSEKTENAAP